MKYLIIVAFFTVGLSANGQHQIWHELLQKHVTESGKVDYVAFGKDRAQLQKYLTALQNTDVYNLSANARKAYYINSYNAYTIELILQNYPIESIRHIKKGDNGPWDIPIVIVQGQMYTLNQVEHQILRKEYNDPHIHAGVNCASVSCPPLPNYAFTAENVNQKLKEEFTAFVNDSQRNTITPTTLKISPIFKWYQEDFTQNQSLKKFLSPYYTGAFPFDASITYRDYNWSLNE